MKGVEYIKSLIPNRYPLLLIDQVLEEGHDWAKVSKNVSINEPFFEGHFPEEPVMPGCLILEGMAQAAGVVLARMRNEEEGKNPEKPRIGYLAGVNRARFHKPVFPGDQLIYEAKLANARGNFYHVEVVATVGGERVAEAVIAIALPS